MHAYRAIVDKRDRRAFLPRPIPDDVLRRMQTARHDYDAGRGRTASEELTRWEGWRA